MEKGVNGSFDFAEALALCVVAKAKTKCDICVVGFQFVFFF